MAKKTSKKKTTDKSDKKAAKKATRATQKTAAKKVDTKPAKAAAAKSPNKTTRKAGGKTGGGKKGGKVKITHQMIAARAYQVYEASGYLPGRDHLNWAEAERQLRRELGLD